MSNGNDTSANAPVFASTRYHRSIARHAGMPPYECYLNTFFALRRVQILMWVLESRDHPAFRDDWAEQARYDLQQLQHFVSKA